MNVLKANIDRFTGFAGIYDASRPKAPEVVPDILTQYLEKAPERVVDMGSGTGLSTFVWCGKAKEIIGIEPNDDMRNQAGLNAVRKGLTEVRFIKADAYDSGLEHSSADIVTCSQSFHWMEPDQALKGIARVLKPGGVFAAYDCDWPPVAGHRAEQAYIRLLEAANHCAAKMPGENKAKQFPKEAHLKNIRECGYFAYSREILFHHRETCSAERFIGIAFSQGVLQTVIQNNPEALENEVSAFRKTVLDNWKKDEITLCYRMRIGVKEWFS